jgi:hypothetical protein
MGGITAHPKEYEQRRVVTFFDHWLVQVTLDRNG